MKFITLFAVLVAFTSAQDYYYDDYGSEIDDMESGGDFKSGLRVDLTKGLRVDTTSEDKKFGAGLRVMDEKPKPTLAGFRVGGGDCPASEMYQIVSGKFPKACIDASQKRLTLKPCGEASSKNLFTVVRTGEHFLLKNQGECLSPTSLTKGPCEVEGLKLNRNGAFHMIEFAKNKCLHAKNSKMANMVKCKPKNRGQHFRLVPVFDAPADATGMRVQQPANDKGAAAGMRVGGGGKK